MVKFLVLQIKMGKMTLETVRVKYPKYYEEVKKIIEGEEK